MASSEFTVYPQAHPGRKINSKDWFGVTPNPGGSHKDWRAYLSISETVVKGLESQVRGALKEKGLHMRTIKAADEPDRVDPLRLMGKELAELRPDVCCSGIPLEGFLLIIRRMASRVNSNDRFQLRKGTGSGMTTRGSAGGHPQKRRRTSVSMDDDSGTESNEDGFSEWDLPQNVPATGERMIGETAQDSTSGPGEEQASLTKAQSMRISLQPKINPDLIWMRITDPESVDQMQVMLLSRLSEHDIDIHTCAGVDLRRLWSLIHANELVSDWLFFDPSKDYLFCKINGTGFSVHYQDALVYACRMQIAAALRHNPGCIPELEFERRIKPEERRKPIWPRESSIPTHWPSGGVAANPSSWAGTPAPPATMTTLQTGPGLRQADSGTLPCAGNHKHYRTWPEESSIRCASLAKPVARADGARFPRLPGWNSDANTSEATSATPRRVPE